MSEDQQPEDDETVVRPRRDAADEPDRTIVTPRPVRDPDATVVTPRLDSRRRRNRSAPSTAPAAQPAPPVEETQSVQTVAPWASTVYGARPLRTSSSPEAPDAIQTSIGAPPPAREAPSVTPRPELPSLARRFKRARVVSVACYAGAVVVAVVGLWFVARLAFG